MAMENDMCWRSLHRVQRPPPRVWIVQRAIKCRYANLLSIPRLRDLRDDISSRLESLTWPQIVFSIFVLRVFKFSFENHPERSNKIAASSLLDMISQRDIIDRFIWFDQASSHYPRRLVDFYIWLARLVFRFVYASGHGERNVKLALPRHTDAFAFALLFLGLRIRSEEEPTECSEFTVLTRPTNYTVILLRLRTGLIWGRERNLIYYVLMGKKS
jgi:hypothetical protein